MSRRRAEIKGVAPHIVAEMMERVVLSSGSLIKNMLAPTAYEMSDIAESPIEISLILALELASSLYWAKDSIGFRPYNLVRPIDNSDVIFWAVPQYPFEIRGTASRIDLMIVRVDDLRPVLALECDGHDFHERTKEQAARDRSRDRFLQSKDIPILRFTGSEIHRNPIDCALEALRMLDEMA